VGREGKGKEGDLNRVLPSSPRLNQFLTIKDPFSHSKFLLPTLSFLLRTVSTSSTQPPTMSKPQVLICGDVIHAQEELNQDLGSIAEVLVSPNSHPFPFKLPLMTLLILSSQRLDSRNRSEFFTECKSGKFSKITSIYRHNSSASSIGFFDSELILNLPSTLKSICHNGAGYDQIDVEAAKQRNIWVSHTPVAVDDATADTAMWLTLSTLRQYPAAERNARKGEQKLARLDLLAKK